MRALKVAGLAAQLEVAERVAAAVLEWDPVVDLSSSVPPHWTQTRSRCRMWLRIVPNRVPKQANPRCLSASQRTYKRVDAQRAASGQNS